MKALSKLEAKKGIWMVDVPEPEGLGPNEVKIKINFLSIICKSI